MAPRTTPTETPETKAEINDDLPAPDDDAAEVETAEPVAAEPKGDDEADARPVRIAPAKDELDNARDRAVARYRELRERENEAARQRDVEARQEANRPDAADEPEEVEPAASEPAEGSEEPVTPSAAPSRAAPTADGQQKRILIVDGKPVEKTLDEIHAMAQITAAADNRLEEAKRLLQEVRAAHQRTANPENPPARQSQTQPPQQGRVQSEATEAENPPHEEVDRDTIKGLIERIQVGDPDDATDAYIELQQHIRRQQPVDDVPKQVRQTIAETQTNEEINKAVNGFKEKYDKLVSDPDLLEVSMTVLAREMRTDLVKAGMSEEDLQVVRTNPMALAKLHRTARHNGAPLRSYDKILDDVGQYVTTKFGGAPAPKPKPQPSPSPSPARAPADQDAAQQRQAAKRAAPQQPRAAGVRGAVNQAPAPKTARDFVLETKKLRGFTT